MKKHRRKQTVKSRSHRSQRAMRSSYMIKRLKFFPAIIITVAASFIWSQPQFTLFSKDYDVLAYATNVSPSGLLSATNTERSAHGVGLLSSNNQLNSAAQAKANDMVTRDYWSHQTPDGQQPWIFFTNAGYQYLSAGENLAYGFMTSSSTVTGWMNSPPHKQNLLAETFSEVGFGIANSPDYVGNGAQTIVVAMYGKPQVPSSTPTPPVEPSAVQKSSTIDAKSVETAATTPDEEPIATGNEISDQTADDSDEGPVAVALTGSPPTAGNTEVQRIQILTGGSAIWSATFVVLGICAIGILWLMHRGFRFRHWLKASEKFVGKHLYLDLTVLAVVYLGFVLLSTSGTIR